MSVLIECFPNLNIMAYMSGQVQTHEAQAQMPAKVKTHANAHTLMSIK